MGAAPRLVGYRNSAKEVAAEYRTAYQERHCSHAVVEAHDLDIVVDPADCCYIQNAEVVEAGSLVAGDIVDNSVVWV